MSFDKWRKRLEIAKLPTVAKRRAALAAANINNLLPDADDEGYYRKPVTQRNSAGKVEIIDWIPVAYYLHNDKLAGVIGDRFMSPKELGSEELWIWIVTNPIEYQIYDRVVKGAEWPDLKLVMPGKNNEAVPAAAILQDDGSIGLEPFERIITRDDNKPPEVLPEVEHAEAIDNAIGAGKALSVTTTDEAAIAAGAANIIRDRRLAAEKVAKKRVDPLKDAYETERNKWLPPLKRAKDAEDMIRAKVSKFEAAERQRIAAEQFAALEKQRAIDEANARAADRAIANGQPEPPPVVEEVVIPQAPEKTKPTYGSYTPRAKPVLKWAVIEDISATALYFKSNPQVVALLQKLATDEIRCGVIVPGTTSREGTE